MYAHEAWRSRGSFFFFGLTAARAFSWGEGSPLHTYTNTREKYTQAQLAANRGSLRLPRWAGEYRPQGLVV